MRSALALTVLMCSACASERAPDRTTPPVLRADALEVVAELPHPPGNVAVSADGRVFVTLHPNAKPELAVAEVVDGALVPYPDARAQKKRWISPLSVRIDAADRLWVLDDAHHGFAGKARIVAFDLQTNEVVHEHRFTRAEAPIGSMLNDFQVAPSGRTIYIADTSFVARRPALLVYDVDAEQAVRRLQKHFSVTNGPYHVHVDDRRITVGGIPLWFGVDSIALDREGRWLYYAAVNAGVLWRIRAHDLADPTLRNADLSKRVEKFAELTLSDGLSSDDAGGIWITDMEHSAIHRVGPDARLTTIVRDPALLRWPDGLSFGPDGWLYVTASALQHYLGRPRVKARVRAHAPYHLLRVRPGFSAAPGH